VVNYTWNWQQGSITAQIRRTALPCRLDLIVRRERSHLKLRIIRMIIEINYTALQWDNHQGGSGMPITGRLLRDFREDVNLNELRGLAMEELDTESIKTRNLIGDYILTSIVIDA